MTDFVDNKRWIAEDWGSAMKGIKRKIIKVLSISMLAVMWLAGCGRSTEAVSEEEQQETRQIVIGFSQLGAESDWRSANTESIRETFTADEGYKLILEDGQQQQSNQIMAIRKFIQQGVDYIILAPVTETGWDTVLEEASAAGIPVIIIDRQVAVSDPNLFTCWVGSDFELEAKKATEWLHQYVLAKDISEQDLNIVNIQGTIGASAQIGRTKGLQDAVEKYGWNLLAEMPGEFTQSKGKEVMEQLLKQYHDIHVVYCENDNEALGAIEAIEDAGYHVGSDIAAGEIMVMSFDGVSKEVLTYLLEDRITYVGECNPEQGSKVQNVIQMLEAGKTPDKYSYMEEQAFAHDSTVTSVAIEDQICPITVMTMEKLRDYQ